MQLCIYGAGLAGLLAANMLRRYKPVIFEAQTSLPHNHDALLRFRSDAVSRETGIPFRKVRVQKGIYFNGDVLTEPRLDLVNRYSMKVAGEVMDRSILDLRPVERWIAPPNLIFQLAEGLDIRYGEKITKIKPAISPDVPSISTMPMPILMELADWSSRPSFSFRDIAVITCAILEPKIEVYQTLYFPGIERPYRASITGATMTIELPCYNKTDKVHDLEGVVSETLNCFGIFNSQTAIVSTKIQGFGKIAPIPEAVRKEFILAMSDKYNVYSLGRYATWRNILLDDVVGDVRVIEGFISQRDNYQQRLEAHK